MSRHKKIQKLVAEIIIIAISLSPFYNVPFVVAAPPASPYTPGETLNPTCAPGDVNCTVDAAVASSFTATSTTATSTFAGGIQTGTLSVTSTTATSTFGNGINLANGCFAIAGICLTGGAGGGITNLNGLTATTQTFATSSDTNLLFTVTSSGSTHTFTPSWTGTLAIARGGTGLSIAPTYGQLMLGNASGGYTLTATSSLGLLTTNVNEGSNLYFTNARADARVAAGIAGTTTTALAEGSNLYYTDARVNSYINSSTTVAKTYSANVFTNSNVFNGALTVGTLNGPLQANAGVVSATTSVGVLYGGTGLSTAPTYGQLLLGNALGGYTLSATSSLGLGSGTVGSGTTGQFGYYAANGTTLTATSTLFLASTGRIGIGTTTPTGKFEVIGGNIVVGNNSGLSSWTSSGGAVRNLIKLNSSNQIEIGQSTAVMKDVIVNGAELGSFTFTNGAFNGYFSYDVFRIDGNTNNVGIGSTTPYGKFVVYSPSAGNSVQPQFIIASSTDAGLPTVDFIVDAYGRTGIGTTSPYAKLSVTNTGSSHSFIVEDSASPDSTPFIITANGQVGIGGTDFYTSAHLQVNDSGGGTFSLVRTDSSITTGEQLGLITFGGTDANNWDASSITSVAAQAFSSGNAGSHLYFSTTPIGSGTRSERMRIDSDGNVGIGTTSPYAKLSVVGEIVGAYFTGTTTATSTFGGGINLASGCFAIAGTCLSTSGGSGTVNSGTTGQFSYYAANGTTLSATSSLFLSTAGNIGIGTTSPSNNLHIFESSGAPGLTLQSAANSGNIGLKFLEADSSSGIALSYDISGNHLKVVNNSTATEIAFFERSNNALGIGVVPTAKLDVQTSSLVSFNVNQTGANNIAQFQDSGTTVMVIADGGNVGIGTTSPYAKLSVVGEIVARNFIATSSTATSTFNGGINIAATTAAGAGIIYQNGVRFIHSGGTNSTFIGSGAGTFSASGDGNTAVGGIALSSITTGTGNIAIGYNALNAGTNETNNVVVGNHSFRTISGNAAGNNVAIGYAAGINRSGATHENVIIGAGSMGLGAGAVINTVSIGYRAGYNVTTGSNNILLGWQAGDNLTSGSNNIILGYDIDATSTTMTRGLNIGNLLFGTGLDGIGTTLSSGNIGIGTSSPYAKLSVVGQIVASSFVGTTTATSTLAGGLQALALNITGSATSTFARGINLGAGCFSIANSCIGAGGSSQWDNITGGINYAGGHVGIGTTTPMATLSVQGPIDTTYALAVYGGNASAGAGGQPANRGSGVLLVGGQGGAATGSTGGSGGVLSFFGGTGGGASSGTAGLGGTINLSAGAGGFGSGGIGGPGGSVFISGGAAGSGSSAGTAGYVVLGLNASSSVSTNVGVGTTSPWRSFAVSGTVAFNGLTSSATGNAICITTTKEVTDAGGGTCTPSSERFKENIVDLGTGMALSTFTKLKVVSFDYKKEFSSPEESPSSIGMIAEELEKIDPRLVDYGYDGKPLTIHFERVTALTVQGIQDLSSLLRVEVSTSTENMIRATRLDDIESRLTALEEAAADSGLLASVADWIGDSITATVGIFKKVKVEDGIEMKDKTTGDIYCVIVEGGELKNIPGECTSAEPASIASPAPSQESEGEVEITPVEMEPAEPAPPESATSTPAVAEAAEELTVEEPEASAPEPADQPAQAGEPAPVEKPASEPALETIADPVTP